MAWSLLAVSLVLLGIVLIVLLRTKDQNLKLLHQMERFQGMLKEKSQESQEFEERYHLEMENHKRAGKNLREYLWLMDTLINSIPNPIYFKDSDGIYQGCNSAFSDQILGVERAQIIGVSGDGLGGDIHSEWQEVCSKAEKEAQRNQRVRYIEIEVTCVDRRRREFLVTLAPVTDNPFNVTGIVGMMHDLTDRNRTEKNRIQKEKIEGVLETAGAVCHELTQPLQALTGFTEVFMSKFPPDSTQHEDAHKILKQAHRISAITYKLQKLTHYKTIECLDGKKILDLNDDPAS